MNMAHKGFNQAISPLLSIPNRSEEATEQLNQFVKAKIMGFSDDELPNQLKNLTVSTESMCQLLDFIQVLMKKK